MADPWRSRRQQALRYGVTEWANPTEPLCYSLGILWGLEAS
ncbi:MAG: hypothetical protein ACOX4G_01020 [Limnochordia bacterium]